MECTFGFVFAVKKSQLVFFRCFEELKESENCSITVCPVTGLLYIKYTAEKFCSDKPFRFRRFQRFPHIVFDYFRLFFVTRWAKKIGLFQFFSLI